MLSPIPPVLVPQQMTNRVTASYRTTAERLLKKRSVTEGQRSLEEETHSAPHSPSKKAATAIATVRRCAISTNSVGRRRRDDAASSDFGVACDWISEASWHRTMRWERGEGGKMAKRIP